MLSRYTIFCVLKSNIWFKNDSKTIYLPMVKHLISLVQHMYDMGKLYLCNLLNYLLKTHNDKTDVL